jgi:hypothetical protein
VFRRALKPFIAAWHSRREFEPLSADEVQIAEDLTTAAEELLNARGIETRREGHFVEDLPGSSHALSRAAHAMARDGVRIGISPARLLWAKAGGHFDPQYRVLLFDLDAVETGKVTPLFLHERTHAKKKHHDLFEGYAGSTNGAPIGNSTNVSPLYQHGCCLDEIKAYLRFDLGAAASATIRSSRFARMKNGSALMSSMQFEKHRLRNFVQQQLPLYRAALRNLDAGTPAAECSCCIEFQVENARLILSTGDKKLAPESVKRAVESRLRVLETIAARLSALPQLSLKRMAKAVIELEREVARAEHIYAQHIL